MVEKRRNVDIEREMDVLCITDELRKMRLLWSRHVVRRGEDDGRRKERTLPVGGRRSGGRQRERETVRRDTEVAEVVKEDAVDGTSWRRRRI